MTLLEWIVEKSTNQEKFDDYQAFSQFISGRRSRLPEAVYSALVLDHGRAWRKYYRKIKGFEGKKEILVLDAHLGPDGAVDRLNAVVLRRTRTDGKILLSLLYGADYLIRKAPGANRERFKEWRNFRKGAKVIKELGLSPVWDDGTDEEG